MMASFYRKMLLVLTTGLGVGFSPFASGTMGSLLGVVLLYALGTGWVLIAVFLAVFFLGVRGARLVAEKRRDKDPSCVVVDEVAGLFLASWFLPLTFGDVAGIFFLFRLYDVWKPFPIKRIERWPNGWGIMCDDLLAGIYARLTWECVKRGYALWS